MNHQSTGGRGWSGSWWPQMPRRRASRPLPEASSRRSREKGGPKPSNAAQATLRLALARREECPQADPMPRIHHALPFHYMAPSVKGGHRRPGAVIVAARGRPPSGCPYPPNTPMTAPSTAPADGTARSQPAHHQTPRGFLCWPCPNARWGLRPGSGRDPVGLLPLFAPWEGRTDGALPSSRHAGMRAAVRQPPPRSSFCGARQRDLE